MRFLHPSLFLYWAPLVLVPIVLYLFRPRPRTVKTSTLPFFKWLDRSHQDSAWLRWLKYILSLLLSVTVVLAGAAALGRLVVSPAADQIKTVVIVVDRSASMEARDDRGRSRLDEAITALSERADGLTAGIGVVVIAYDKRPEVLLARSVDRRQVQRALAAIRVRPMEGNSQTALALARQLAALETPAAIWHATDMPVHARHADGEPGSEPDSTATGADDMVGTEPVQSANGSDVVLDHLSFPIDRPVNAGITAVDIRRLPLERGSFEAFVQVQATGPEPVTATLDVRLDGKEVDLRELTIEPGTRETLLVEIKADAQTDRIAELRVSTEGDRLAADDVVYVHIPKLRPIRVLWISDAPDPYTQLALSSMGADNDLEVFQGAPSAWPTEEDVDVVIFDDWLPDQWPDSVAALVINPPASVGPINAMRLEGDGLPVSNLRATGEGHPLLFGVATGRVEVSQTAVLEAHGPLQPLWVGDQGPLMLAGQFQGQRIAVFGFNPQLSSELPFLASYPLLIGNAIYWAAEHELEKARGINRRTGELITLNGSQLRWMDPQQPDKSLRTVRLEKPTVELDQVGLWKTDTGQIGSASVLSASETKLPGLPPNVNAQTETSPARSLLRGDLTPVLLWTVLAIFVLESLLYHRCITN